MSKLVVNMFVTLDGVRPPVARRKTRRADSTMAGGHSDTGTTPWATGWGRRWASRSRCCWGAGHTRSSPHIGRMRGDQPGAAELNSATKYVVSRTLDSVEWANSALLEGDAADAVARLKEEDGPDPGAWQLRPHSDVARKPPRRRVQGVDLSRGAGNREAPVRRGNDSRWPPASGLENVDERGSRSHVSAGGRAEVRLVRIGKLGALDNGRRSPKKHLRSVVARLLGLNP